MLQVLTHRSGSVSMLSLIYSEILKMLRMWGVLNFDVEIFFPHDPHSSPKGYLKQKSKESDHSHIMTSESLLVQVTILLFLSGEICSIPAVPFQRSVKQYTVPHLMFWISLLLILLNT